MGTFMGHIIPGTFFLVASVWWSVNIWLRYFQTRLQSPTPTGSPIRRSSGYRSQCAFSIPRCRNFPIEGVFKVVAALLGITGEASTGFQNGHFVHMMNLQHISMFAFYGLNGAVDLLLSVGLPLPPGSDYVSLIIAVSVEWLLFFFHLHGRSPLDVHVHTLLTIILAATVTVLLLEMKYRDQPMCAVLRAIVIMLQGSWFYQIGFILFNPVPGSIPWEEDSHDQIMVVTALFTAHIAGSTVTVFLLGALVRFCMKRTSSSSTNDIPFQRLTNGKVKIATPESDEESSN